MAFSLSTLLSLGRVQISVVEVVIVLNCILATADSSLQTQAMACLSSLCDNNALENKYLTKTAPCIEILSFSLRA